jgi:hypothetical protein
MHPDGANLRDEYCLVLTPTSTAALRASEAVRRHFEDLQGDTRRDLSDVVHALVHNTVMHGPKKAITVTIAVSDYLIRGEVSGNGGPIAGLTSVRDRPLLNGNGSSNGNGNGNGLASLDDLCSRWSVYEGSTDVWFEIPLFPLTQGARESAQQ